MIVLGRHVAPSRFVQPFACPCRLRAGVIERVVAGAHRKGFGSTTRPPEVCPLILCYTYPVPNLTLAIDADLLQRARIRAVREGRSVNAVVRDYLSAYAGSDEVADARQHLVELSRNSSAGSGRTGRGWTRDDLHER